MPSTVYVILAGLSRGLLGFDFRHSFQTLVVCLAFGGGETINNMILKIEAMPARCVEVSFLEGRQVVLRQ